jgi:hypothetical protein
MNERTRAQEHQAILRVQQEREAAARRHEEHLRNLERIQAQAATAARQRDQAVPTAGPALTPVDGHMELPLPTSLPPTSHYIGDRSSRNAPAVDTTRARAPKRKAEGGETQPSRVRARTTRGSYGTRSTVGDGRPAEARSAPQIRSAPDSEQVTQPSRRRPRTGGLVTQRVEDIEIRTEPVRRRRPNQT